MQLPVEQHGLQRASCAHVQRREHGAHVFGERHLQRRYLQLRAHRHRLQQPAGFGLRGQQRSLVREHRHVQQRPGHLHLCADGHRVFVRLQRRRLQRGSLRWSELQLAAGQPV